MSVFPDLDVLFGTGLANDATVTPPAGVPIATRVIVHAPRASESPEGGGGTETIQEISLRRDQVPTLKTGTTITILDGPDAGRTFTVDGISGRDAQAIRAVVHSA